MDISRNNITGEGTKILVSAFEKASRPVCQSLEELDLSMNPITDDGFKSILKLSQYVRLKMLKLNCCSITENGVMDANRNTSFDSLESIDLSNNEIKQVMVSWLMTSLNPNLITDLELDNIGAEGSVVGCIAAFMDTAKELKIRRFGLSSCKLVDGQFMRLYRFVNMVCFHT